MLDRVNPVHLARRRHVDLLRIIAQACPAVSCS
jgi:hypothetical protein